MKLTMILVDDDPLMHRMLLPRLQEMETRPPVGTVSGARTPEDALRAVEATPPGALAVVSDFNLKASMNGLVLLRRVREIRPEALRVLFSGYSLEQLGDVQGSGDVHAFLEKPLLLDDLLVPLAALIEKRFEADPARAIAPAPHDQNDSNARRSSG